MASLISITEKYLKKYYPLNSCRAQWLWAHQADGEDFDGFFCRVLALGKESEVHTFDETAGNIMVLCAGTGPHWTGVPGWQAMAASLSWETSYAKSHRAGRSERSE